MDQGLKEHLFRATLPPALIIDKFVPDVSVGYEDYLTEFINNSRVFKLLSGGEQYELIPKDKQSDKECDCYSKYYDIDFKRFGATTILYASSNLSQRIARLFDGITILSSPKQTDGMVISITNLLLKQASIDDLEAIAAKELLDFDRDHYSEELDIQNLLKIARCNKNCLFFHTDYVFSDTDFSLELIISSVEYYLNECLSSFFLYRESHVPNKDTFFAIIIQNNLCIAECKNGHICFSEKLPLNLSKSFCVLYEYAGKTHKEHLKL